MRALYASWLDLPVTESGILLIDKPEGPSSTDIVRRVKAILRPRRIGHLGTLDPFASGLLPLGINQGTKIATIFLTGSKTYHGVMTLGVQTDTQDATGRVVRVRPVMPFGDCELRALERQFTGDLQQIPPMFSALKQRGVRLYELARQGREVPREPRNVRIDELRLHKLNSDHLEFDVSCSRGTYVRALAADLGETLGCGAHVKSLRRLACDHLTVERAIGAQEVERLHAQGKLPLIALEAALKHIPAVTWEGRNVSRLCSGQQDLLAQLERPRNGQKLLRIQNPQGQLAALVEWNETLAGGRWQLFRVFHH